MAEHQAHLSKIIDKPGEEQRRFNVWSEAQWKRKHFISLMPREIEQNRDLPPSTSPVKTAQYA